MSGQIDKDLVWPAVSGLATGTLIALLGLLLIGMHPINAIVVATVALLVSVAIVAVGLLITLKLQGKSNE